jgi:hypothetical protein
MIDTSTCETFDQALDRVCESMDGRDVMEELWDVKDVIVALLKAGRGDMAGKVVEAAFNAYVYRVAAHGFFRDPIKTQSAQEAAAAVMAK